MTKIAIKGRLALDDMQGTWEKSREALVASLGDLQDGVVAAVNGGLSSENTTSYYDVMTLTHGVATRVKNPLSVPCQGVYAVRCVGVEMSGGKPTRKLYSLSTPAIDWEQGDTKDGDILLITARYPAPVGACVVNRTAALSPVNNDALAFDTTETQLGSLSLSSGSILCAVAGFVQFNASVCWTADAAGNYRGFVVNKTGSTDRYVSTRVPSETGGASVDVFTAGSAIIPVAAGNSIIVYVQHDAGAGVALSVGNARTRCDAHYVAPPIGTTGKVTLFFYGG